MLIHLFDTTAATPPGDALRRACDAIMHSRDVVVPAADRSHRVHLDAAVDPPAAATVELLFRRQYPSGLAIDIPRATRVAAAGAPGVTFMTGRSARIEPGQDEVRVLAYHAEFVNGELLGFVLPPGIGGGFRTGGIRRTSAAARFPIVEATTADLELTVGVRCDADEAGEADRLVMFDGRLFRLWAEAGSAWAARPGGGLFMADRMSGAITLVPPARQPGAGAGAIGGAAGARREVRAWYWRGGGAVGNVAAGTLHVLLDSIGGVVVINPCAARGGRDAAPIGAVEYEALASRMA